MQWLQSNWLWLLFGGFFVWMHLSGRSCCSHKNHGNKADDCHDDSTGEDKNNIQKMKQTNPNPVVVVIKGETV